LFRYLIQLPFRLRISKDQIFPLLGVEASVVLKFYTPPDKEGEPLVNTVLIMDSDKSIDADPYWSFAAYSHINNIIRGYQIVTKDIFNNGKINQLTWNQFSCSYQYAEIDEQGKPKGDVKTLFVSVGISPAIIDKAEYEEIKALAESPDLISKRSLEESLVRARIFQEQHNFRMSILEAIIALEFALYSLVRNSTKSKGMTKEKTESLIFNLGLAQILDSLGLFSNDLPSPEIVDSCKKANKIRNKIVHEARLTVTAEEAQQALASVESFLSHFEKQID
jgi:hypothetical protein